MFRAHPLACLSVTAPCAVAWLSWSKDVHVELLRLEQPPDDDHVIPADRNMAVAWAWVSFVTANASCEAVSPTPGANSTPSARTSALRTERNFMGNPPADDRASCGAAVQVEQEE